MNWKGNLHQLLNNWNFLALLWLILNLMQVYFTPLIDDEAYYWMYSRHLDWGYFDHPPMVGLFIKLGYGIFQNELGVRLLTVLSQIIMLRVVWELIDHPRKKEFVLIFFGIAFCLPMLQVYGIFATPDAPLLLFGSLTVLAYRNFQKRDNFQNILLFALSSAALMYSKYHGGLLLIFIILSDLKLLRKPTFYLVGILSLLHYLPHVYWQYINDFPSFQYHLSDRVTIRKWWFIPEYVFNQFIIYNPLLWLIIVPLIRENIQATGSLSTRNLINSKPNIQRTLYFIFYGFLIFFFLVSLRMRHIEPQWTVFIVIPVIVLAFEYLIENPKRLKGFKIIAIISIVLLMGIRLVLAFPIIDFENSIHHTKQEIKAIEQYTDGLPAIYMNSYQNASLHAFYSTHQYSNCWNTTFSWRDNQYSNWNLNEEIHAQDVVLVSRSNDILYAKNGVLPSGDSIFYRKIDDYFNLQNVKIERLSPFPERINPLDTFDITIKITNPYSYDIPIHVWAIFGIYGETKIERYRFQFRGKLPPNLKAGESQEVNGTITVPKIFGEYDFNWTIVRDKVPSFYHADFEEVTVENEN